MTLMSIWKKEQTLSDDYFPKPLIGSSSYKSLKLPSIN